MGDHSDWLAAYLALGGTLCGLGLLLLFSLDRTRTNLCVGFFFISVGLAIATPLPFVDDVDRSDPGWTARLGLIGAPLPRPDHAVAGLALASELLAATRPAVEHWATGIHPLGVGLGVASGRVTVGAIGSTARMEYTAVGTAVNLAVRLCSAAADGEILVDHRTVELAGTDDVAPRGSLQVKGLSSDQAVYAVLA